MELLRADWLWALWALPALAALVYAFETRAAARRRRFLGELAPRMVRGGGAHAARAALVGGGLAAAVVGLAGPAWGERWEEVRSDGVDVVVLLDVSRSMLAEDAAPNRLARAKIAIGRLVDLLERTGGHRIGLVAFAGTPAVRSPLTRDYAWFRDVLDGTDPRAAARGGTLIGDAVRRGLELLEGEGEQERLLLLLTDGEDHESFPLEAARAAAAAGVTLHAVGIGSAVGGSRIPVDAGSDGRREYLRHRGEAVVTRLDEDTLVAMARATGGVYVPAETRTIPLDEIYAEAIASRDGNVSEVTRERRVEDRFQWAVGLALALVLASRFAAPGRRADVGAAA